MERQAYGFCRVVGEQELEPEIALVDRDEEGCLV